MKLRIRGNTIRFRLTQSEVAGLRAGESLRETTEFAPAQILAYALEPAAGIEGMQAGFANGVVGVRLPESEVAAWADGDAVGLYGRTGVLDVAIEKDFQCLTRAGSAEEADAFPNPHAGGKC
jgi:hypothetical protein